MTRGEVPTYEEVAAEVERLRGQRLRRLDPLQLRWLAIAPEWTSELAKQCEFPPGTGGLEAMLRAARGLRLCETAGAFDAQGRQVLRFWMPAAERARLFAEWEPKEGPDLRRLAAEIAERLGKVAEGGLRRWADLAKEEIGAEGHTGETLMVHVTAALDDDDTGEALAWLAAGESLTPMLGGEMQSAVVRARRRISLQYRVRRDERYLSKHLERPELVETLERLFKPESDIWGAHFVGMGGVGKTMLVRYLTGRYATQHSLATARIDFDHVDPRYPTEQPGQLLQVLAEGLTIFAGGGTQESLRRSLFAAISAADRKAEEVAKAVPDDPLAPVRTDEVASAVDAFIAFADSLERPVGLVLDTCEELAKLHPVAESVPSVVATFEMLRPIAERAKLVRVVFAGRRMLTNSAKNWKVDSKRPQPAVMTLDPQPRLLVHEVRGFDALEVSRYFSEILELDVSDTLLEAVKEASEDTGRVAGFPKDDDGGRYNPFDVDLYADWIKSDPDVGAKAIAARDLTTYINVRIVDRMKREPDAVAALPAAVLLGRFDAATIGPALSDDPEKVRRTVLTLGEQEWIDTSPGARDGEPVLEIEPNLLPRLVQFYQQPERREELLAAEMALVPVLHNALESDRPSELTLAQIDAALRVLPPEVSAPAFDRLALRVAEEGAWWRARECGNLLAPERDQPLPPEVRASVRALWIGGLRHAGSRGQLAAAWAGVADEAPLHPEPVGRERLAMRAALGRIVAAAEEGRFATREEFAEIGEALSDDAVRDLAPSLLAAAEATLELAEARRPEPGAELAFVFALTYRCAAEGGTVTRLWAEVLRARADALAGDPTTASLVLNDLASGWPDADIAQPYADLLLPAAPVSRILLDTLRFALVARRETTGLVDVCEVAAERGPQTIDDERLLSLALQTRLANGWLVTDAGLEELELRAKVAAHRPSASAHRAAPPLLAAVVDAWLAQGRPERAIALALRPKRIGSPPEGGLAFEGDSALTTLRALRRLRLNQRSGQVRQLSVADDRAIRVEAQVVRALVSDENPDRWRNEPGAEWVAFDALDPGFNTFVAGRASELSVAGFDESASGRLAKYEIDLVQLRLNDSWGQPVTREAIAAEVAHASADVRDPLQIEACRLALRAYALGILPEVPEALADRRALYARLAFEEGELMALRVPERGAVLLDVAAENTSNATVACMATLRAAIALVHAGDAEAARERLDQIEARYRIAAQADEALPSWDELEGFRFAAPRSTDLEGPWSEWIERLLAFRLWCHDPDSPALESMSAPSELRMRAAYGASGRRLPRRWRSVRAAITEVAPVAVIMLLLAVGALAVLGQTGVGTVLAVALALVIAAPLGLLFERYAATVLLGSMTAVATTDLDIFPSESDNARATIVVGIGARTHAFRVYLRVLERLMRTTRRGADVRAAAEPFEEELPGAVLSAVRQRGPLRKMPVRLTITPTFATAPWESRLVAPAAIADRAWSPARGQTIWRATPRPALASARWSTPPVTTVIAAREWHSFVTRAWLPEQTMRSMAPELPVAGSRAVLVIGSPEPTGGGWRMRIGDGSDEARFQPSPLDPEIGRAGSPVVIAVATPAGETPTPDRRTSDGLRGFADETFFAGAWAVLTIPPLPPPLAQALVSDVAEAVAKWDRPPSSRALTDLVTDMRESVFNFGGVPPSADEAARRQRIRVALDICLYAND